MNQPPIDERLLHAYVDGQLGPHEAEAVARWLQAHPEDAAQVLTWRTQRSEMQGLKAELLDAPVPPHLLEALRPANEARWPQAWAAALLLAVGLSAGAGLGWGLHAWHAAQGSGDMVSEAPRYVRDAAIAHVLYQVEQRHPVEVGAAEQAHLVQWLSKRLGRPLRVPDLRDQGYQLVGGRLLPAAEVPQGAALPQLARAQFMYENSAGSRLTLYVSVSPSRDTASTQFRVLEQREGGRLTHSVYWLDGQLGYALNGALDAHQLSELSRLVYARLTPSERP